MESFRRSVSMVLPILGMLVLPGCAPERAAEITAADAGHADRMAHEHAGEAPVASPAAQLAPRRAVRGTEVAYAELDGKPVRGYRVEPAEMTESGTALPGLIVIQEWWGLNDNIRAMADRFAGEGYVVLAVDLYEGKVAATSDEALALMQQALGDPARLTDNLRQAHGYLRETAGASKIGVVGWCFGGGWSLATALALGDEIDAAVMYYGRTVDDRAELAKLQAPLLGLFGGADEGIPVAGVRAMEAALHELGKQAEIVIYDGADHAFANPSGERYQPDAATDSWRRTTEFFERHLR